MYPTNTTLVSNALGSARPGYRNEQVTEWIEFMQNQDIKRVCCLLLKSQLSRYTNLLDIYRKTFGLTTYVEPRSRISTLQPPKFSSTRFYRS